MTSYSPQHPAVLIHGRTVPQSPLPLFWTGSGVEFTCKAADLALDFSAEYTRREPWVRIEIDDIETLRTSLPKGHSRLWIWRDLPPGQSHRVRLYKEVPPVPFDPGNTLLLQGIVCNGTIRKPLSRTFKLEFIGDSVSAGEGLVGGRSVRGNPSMVYSTRGHYAVEVARRLHADFRILAQSGFGLALGSDNDPARTMPRFYKGVCSVLTDQKNLSLGAGEKENLKTWQPDVVVVHLGYNDGFALDKPAFRNAEGQTFKLSRGPDGLPVPESSKLVEQAALGFLYTLHQCRPNAAIVWAYGMLNDPFGPALKKAIQTFADSTGVSVPLVMLPAVRPDQIGANDHPGAAAHRAAADTLTPILKQILRARELAESE